MSQSAVRKFRDGREKNQFIPNAHRGSEIFAVVTQFSGLWHSCGTSAKNSLHSFSDNSASFWAEWTKPSTGVSSQNTSEDRECASFSMIQWYLPCGDVANTSMQITWLLTIMCSWIHSYFLNPCTCSHSKTMRQNISLDTFLHGGSLSSYHGWTSVRTEVSIEWMVPLFLNNFAPLQAWKTVFTIKPPNQHCNIMQVLIIKRLGALPLVTSPAKYCNNSVLSIASRWVGVCVAIARVGRMCTGENEVEL